jgi:hypothetical protein
MAHTAKLVEQLRLLLQLTQTEVQVAQTRVAQARTDAVRRELTQNAAKGEERSRLISEQLRELGGVPDVVSPALGRVTAVVKAGFEQAEPMSEALLQDLALEHQLLDRARYLKVLAKTAEQPKVVKLADRLITAHSATVDWLTTVLAEEALGGPAALATGPLQKAAGTASRVVNLPSRLAVEGINRGVDTVAQSTEQARARLSEVTGKAAQSAVKATQVNDVAVTVTGKAYSVAEAAREALATGRQASLTQAEKVARRTGSERAVSAVQEARRRSGTVSADELPIAGYDSKNITDAVAAIKKLSDPADLRAVVNYEEANKKRSSVVSAAQTRLGAVAKEAVGIS